MYEAYLLVGNNANRYMQEDFKLLFKLYPEHKKQLKKALALWDELYLPLDKNYKLMRYFQYSLKDNTHENYKETEKEKVDYLHEMIRQQEDKNYKVKKHIQQNTRLIMHMYIELYKIHKKKKDYTNQVYYFSKVIEKMEIYYAKAPQKLLAEYGDIIKQYEKLEDYKNALKYAIKHLELKEKTFGLIEITTIESYHQVSALCTLCGKHKKSVKYYNKMVSFMETDLKSVDMKRENVYRHLAQLYVNVQDNRNAIKYYKKSFDILGVDYRWLEEASLKSKR